LSSIADSKVLNKETNNIIFDKFRSTQVVIAGPCAVESEDQIARISAELRSRGIKFIRGGAFKPRTSSKTFQGMGEAGIDILRNAADKNGFKIVTEVLDSTQLEQNYDKIDIIQIGSRNMASYGLLKQIGKKTAADNKPVLLKRGFSATIKELLFAADYIRDEGNPNVLLCLRGIRTFEQIDSYFRFTPDLAAILELKERTRLPVIFDPSHSAGDSRFVVQIAKAALQLGANGLLVETHYDPSNARIDGQQSILPEQLDEILSKIK
jgi:3-deoxy-7-phosphoheptulonate synthase